MPYTILVTGANKGIGYEAVKLLSQQKPDATILLGCRTVQKGDDAIAKMKASLPSHPFSNVKILPIDVTDAASIRDAVHHVRTTYTTLDVLIQNSGISNLNGDALSPAIFDVNVRGAKNTIEAFTPILTPTTGIITLVSSTVSGWYMSTVDPLTRAHLDDIPSVSWGKIEGWMEDWDAFAAGKEAEEKWVPLDQGLVASKYCVSKALINPWIRSYAAHHPELRIAVVCPGYCATDLNNFAGTRSAEEGGKSVVWPVLSDFESGKFYLDGAEVGYSQSPF